MEMRCRIEKRSPCSSPNPSLEDTQDEYYHIDRLVSDQKVQLSKRLFYEVNKQSLSSLMNSSFIKPRRTSNGLIAKRSSHLEIYLGSKQQQQNTENCFDSLQRDCITRMLRAIKNTFEIFKSVYSISAPKKEIATRSKSTRLNSSHPSISRMPSSA